MRLFRHLPIVIELRLLYSASEKAVDLYQDYGTQLEERFEGYDIRRRPLSTSASIHQLAPQELVLSTQISLVDYLRSVVCTYFV